MRIAGIETLEFLFSEKRDEYYYISSKLSSGGIFFIENFPKENMILSEMAKVKDIDNDITMVKHRELTKKLNEKKIEGYFPYGRSSYGLEKWGRDNNIKILASPWSLQKKIENKIFFDKLLKKRGVSSPKSWIIESEKEIELIDKFPVILQGPSSWACEETFLIKSKSEIKRMISGKNLKYPILCREYIKGIPMGITVILDGENMIFSSIRAQAVGFNEEGTLKYYGLQWVKTKDINKKAIKKIEEEVTRISMGLMEIGLKGIASIDFMLKDDDVFILECNPRMSMASPQISQNTELLHNYEIVEEFTKAVCDSLINNAQHIPKTDYEGCVLRGRNYFNEIKKENPGPLNKGGIYKLEKDHLEEEKCKTKRFKDKNNFFIHTYASGEIEGMLFNRPLFEINENGCKLNDTWSSFSKAMKTVYETYYTKILPIEIHSDKIKNNERTQRF